MRGILGKKIGMTRIFNAEGQAVPVTVIKAGPCVVTALRTDEQNGYEAIQIGFDELPKGKKFSRPVKGQYEKNKLHPHRTMGEVRNANPAEYTIGQALKADIFKEGEKVDVIGTSIGKGFAGGMKRHNFNGSADSHGSTVHRRPCSAGATDAARTFKGKRSPGHMGAVRKTVQSLEVVKVDADNNLILLKGAVPGPKNGTLLIRQTVKVARKKKPKLVGTQTK